MRYILACILVTRVMRCLQDPNFVSDAYAECYPSYHALGTEIVESDDEDLGHMDAKARALPLGCALRKVMFPQLTSEHAHL